ncbi:adipose-secreted signaling protein [Chironomus tepperi]|uniref:adipose-secreted signaling protein n=1 Tax=Chironomus tepperi TaxID=113505 RepID=UPI00391F4076
MSDAEDHHVHFNVMSDDFESDHSHPVIQKGPHGRINVHLGFLQVKHRYRIQLNIPVEILEHYCHKNHKLILKVEENSVPNIHCKLLSFKGKDTDQSQVYEAEFEFFAHKEKLLKEEIKLLTSDEKTVKFLFHARVLGRGKGTPMLKEGIHLLGIEEEEESDASDWQGFSRKEPN